MTMTDPVADMLTRLRNANTAMHDEVTLPSSNLKANIAEILVEKHRNGPVGAAELYFDGQHVRFLNLDTHHMADASAGNDDF